MMLIDDLLNKILIEDCVKGMEKIPNNSIDLIVADPPYGISRDLNCKNKRLGSTARLNFNYGDWDKFNEEWFDIALDKTKGWIMTFCAKKDIGFYWNKLENKGFVAIDTLVWQKPDPVPFNAKTRFLNAWEAIVVGKRPGAHWASNYMHNIFKYQAPKNSERMHPTQKPVRLIEELILLTTKKGNIVLDPFMGSGTTAVAAIQTERFYIGFEIDRNYAKLAKERLRNLNYNLKIDFKLE